MVTGNWDAARIKALKKRHLLHPNTALAENEAGSPLPIIVKGKGAVVTDIDGKEYLDGVSSLWLANIGYGRSELAEVAKNQMNELSYWSLFWGFGNVPAVDLAVKLAELAPAGLSRVFFTSGGSEANETSLKMARLYHVRRGEPGRHKVIALTKAYHGVSYGAMSATGLEGVRANYEPYVGGFSHIPSPYCYRCPFNKEYPSCALHCADELEREILRQGPDTVAAFIAEPIGGVGGVITPPQTYFKRIREICDKYGVLFIADEVICGFGRMGHWFGSQSYDVVPDLISSAKGISSGYQPVGAVLVHDRVYEGLKGEDGNGILNHGFTYSGHPVGTAVSMENIRILEQEGLLHNATEMGAYLMKRLWACENPYIGDVRGRGLMLGAELVADRKSREIPAGGMGTGKKVEALCRERGLILRVLAPGNIVAIAPPLVINREQVDQLVSVLDQSIREVVSEAEGGSPS